MSLETDLLLDRRRLKRRLFFWRSFAVVAVLAVILVALRGSNPWFIGSHVARLTVSGIITADRKLDREVAKLADDTRAKALLVLVDSPGGSVAGGQALHDAIARVAEKKPVVVVMGGTAASAGYMIAVPAARIFAQESTLTGSIGVLLETGDISGLLKSIGVSADPIVSGPLKDQPSFVKPLSSEGRQMSAGTGDGHVRPVRRHGGPGPTHGRRPGAGTGRWPSLYGPAGDEARTGRCHRGRAGCAPVAGAGEGDIVQPSGRGRFQRELRQQGLVDEPRLDPHRALEKRAFPRSYP